MNRMNYIGNFMNLLQSSMLKELKISYLRKKRVKKFHIILIFFLSGHFILKYLTRIKSRRHE